MAEILAPDTPLPTPNGPASPPGASLDARGGVGPESQAPERSFGDSYAERLLGACLFGTPGNETSVSSKHGASDASTSRDEGDSTRISNGASILVRSSPAPEGDESREGGGRADADADDSRTTENGDFGETQVVDGPTSGEGDESLLDGEADGEGLGEISMVMATADTPLEADAENGSQLAPTQVDSDEEREDESMEIEAEVSHTVSQEGDGEKEEEEEELKEGDTATAPSPYLLVPATLSPQATSGPSSSAVVAQDLFSPVKVKRGALPSSPGATEPQSRADPHLSRTFFVEPKRPRRLAEVGAGERREKAKSSFELSGSEGRKSRSGGSRSGGVNGSTSFSGPETSTPAMFGAPLPHPLTAARTIPSFTFLPAQTLPTPLVPPPKSIVSPVKPIYQSASALRDLAKRPSKVQREAWDGISQESTAEDDGEKDMTLDEDETGNETATPRPTAGATDDMELDDEASVVQPSSPAAQDEEEPKDESLDPAMGPLPARQASLDVQHSLEEAEPKNESFDPSLPPPAQAPQASASDQSSLEPDFRRRAGAAPLLSPDLDDSQSQSLDARREPHRHTPLFGPEFELESPSQSQALAHAVGGARNSALLDDSLPDDSHGRRLSDISDLKSSMEEDQTQPPSQIVVEATQVEYDIEVYNNKTAGSADDADDSTSRSLPRFLHETGTTDNSSSRRSLPHPGRELRRNPPPPSAVPPVDDSQDSEDSPSVPLLSTAVRKSSPPPPPSPAPAPPPAAASPPPNVAPPPSSPPVPLSSVVPSTNSFAPSNPQQPLSSNGIVPDSEGPTQEAPSPKKKKTVKPVVATASSERPKRASTSAAVVAEVEDSEGEEEVEEDVEEEIDEEEVAAVAPKGKGKGKEKAAPAKPRGRPPKDKKGKGKAKAKENDKGKGKAVERIESLDELDLLRDPVVGADDDEPKVEPEPEPEQEEEEFFNETNYNDPPEPSNARRISRGRTSASAVVVVAPLPPRKRRISSVAVEAPPAKRVKAAPTEKKAKAQPPNPKPKVVKAAGPKKKGGRGKKAASVAEPPVEPENAVAGPSKVRFEGNEDEEMEDGEAAGDVSVDSRGTGNGKRAKSRLPDTAPFKRIFGYWRDDQWFYPSTILDVVNGELRVQFDDGSRGSLKYSEARRCELQRGDRLEYRGDDYQDPETLAPVLATKVRVVRVERGTTGFDAVGELQADDVVVVEPADTPVDEEGGPRKTERVTLDAITIPPTDSAQLDDRKLSANDIAGFEGRDRKPAKEVHLLQIPASPAVKALEVNKLTTGLFSGFGLIVTQRPFEEPKEKEKKKKKTSGAEAHEAQKEAYFKLVQKHGGTPIDLEQLFDVVQDGLDVSLRFKHQLFAGLDTILLLTDRPLTTPKYLVALALGIPCVSREFIPMSLENGARIDWRLLALTSGEATDLGTWIVGGQLRALFKKDFGLESIQTAAQDGGVFRNTTILVVVVKKGKPVSEQNEKILSLRRIFAAAGATRVDFVGSADAASTAADYTYVILDEAEATDLPEALEDHAGVKSVDWLKECLIAGRIVA